MPYHLYWKVLNAKHHGVPQNRERVFLIGIRDDKDNSFQFPKEEHLDTRLKDVLEHNVNDKYLLSEKMLEAITFQEKTNGEIANLNKGGERGSVYDSNTKAMSCLSATDYKQPKMIKVGNVNPSGIGMNGCVYGDKGISPTLWTGHGEGVKIKSIDIRRLTPRECFRLMDFPDTFTWKVSDSQAYKQAGNSIVVNVLYKILKQLPL